MAWFWTWQKLILDGVIRGVAASAVETDLGNGRAYESSLSDTSRKLCLQWNSIFVLFGGQFIWYWDNLQLQLQHQLGQDFEQSGASLKASKSNVKGYCEVNRFLFQTALMRMSKV